MSREAEQNLIGGLLMNHTALERVADIITERDFYDRSHQIIYQAMITLDEGGKPFDVLMVSERLEQIGELETVGGLAYLGALAKNVASVANVKSYAKLIREKSIEQGLLSAANEIAGLVNTPGETADKVDKAESLIMGIAERRVTAGPKRAEEILPGVVDDLERRAEQGGGITGLSTGLIDLDNKLCGLQPSDLIVIAGRPSMGKSALMLNIAENVALKQNEPVVVFSLEMPGRQLMQRTLASVGGIDIERLRFGQVRDEDWPRVADVTRKLNGKKLFIDDSPALTVTDIRARARRLKRQQGLSLILIDYLQIMGGQAENETLKIGAITGGLKALAKELDIPVVLLSQLNRNLEQRNNKRPKPADLRQSGAIEQDADVILLLYRDEVYEEDSDFKGLAELNVAKQRMGPTGTMWLVFMGHLSKFESCASPPIRKQREKRNVVGFDAKSRAGGDAEW